MFSKSRHPNTNYQKVGEIPHDALPFKDEAVSISRLKTASTFEVDIINAFDFERFHHYFRTSLRPPNRHSQELSQKPLVSPRTIENELQSQTFFERNFSGWRGGIASNAVMACSVLLLNLTFLIWATAKFEISKGLATIFNGDCITTKRLSIVAHIIINILSTLLLGASNYAMQIASSPSRDDVDKAHQKHIWLDIGVLSIRNFRWISGYRLMAYILLLVSSLPLHVMYNSVLSSSLATLEFGPVILCVTEEYFQNPNSSYNPPPFINGASYLSQWNVSGQSLSNFSREAIWNESGYSPIAAKVRMDATFGQLKQVGVNECNKAQTNFLKIQYESLVFVQTSTTPENNSFLDIGVGISFFSPIDPVKTTDCWAGAAKGLECQLFFNLSIMIIVVIANLIKSCVMILMVLKFTKPSLVTPGDAIASFLTNEDCTTTGLRAINQHDDTNRGWIMKEAMPYKQNSKRWGSSPGGLRWALSLLTCITFIATAAGFYSLSVKKWGGIEGFSLWHLGFGQPVSRGSLTSIGFGGLASYPAVLILISNIPQIALSMGYVVVNNLLTAMLAAREWSRIGIIKTRLRTTTRQGQQRSTYFLQLPYRYSLPLMMLLGSLHYVVSESLFVDNFVVYGFVANGALHQLEEGIDQLAKGIGLGGVEAGWSINYSPLAIIIALSLSGLLLVVPIALAFRKLSPGIPMVGSNSALISAACHPPPEEGNASLLPVQWGVIKDKNPLDPETEILRCTISSGEVSKPIDGHLYH